MGKNVVVVGGGLAGLAASIYLARGGRTVTLFERRRDLGGRAITHLRRGFRLNLGPHAINRAGAGVTVYRELGIPIDGRRAPVGGLAITRDEEFRLPSTILSLALTSLLTARGKRAFAATWLRIARSAREQVKGMTFGEWLDANVSDDGARGAMEAFARLGTYSERPRDIDAAAALAQLRAGMRGVVYVHEGWQKLVDLLRSAAVAAGVTFVTSSRVVAVDHDGAVRGIELGGLEIDTDHLDTQSLALPSMTEATAGTRIPAETVVLAVDPETAAELVGGDVAAGWRSGTPVTAACLDVALSSLPDPERKFAIGIDEPLYFSVHTSVAQLAPKGGAVIHAARYGGGADSEAQLDALLDRMQPGWRDRLVHRRFLPSMVVANALPTPSWTRPSAKTAIEGLYIAGDWVGETGMLSDAALASARTAAKTILGS